MRFIYFLMIVLFCANVMYANPGFLSASSLRCEYLENPEGIERLHPRLSWQMSVLPGSKGQKITAYQVIVASTKDILNQNEGDLWDTGKISSQQPVNVAYNGKALNSLQECFWKVKLWDQEGAELPWSDMAKWSMGILTASEWQGKWIGYVPEKKGNDLFAGEWFDNARWIWYKGDDKNNVQPCIRFFRRQFNIASVADIVNAEILFTANDAFQLTVNGSVISEDMVIFNAADSAFQRSIKSRLKDGQNTISVVGEKYKPTFQNHKTKEVAGIIGVVKITFKDGHAETIVTDEKWQSRASEQENWSAAADVAGASTHWRKMPGWRQLSPSPVFRKAFTVPKKIVSAKIAISGLGYYELYCNGDKVGDHRLDPAFTNYDSRVLYVCYDITELLKTGGNALGVMLGSGWYDMHTRATWDFDQAPWRDNPKMLAQLLMTYEDGSKEMISTDESWKATTGPIRHDGIRNGEIYDARLEKSGWCQPDCDETQWAHAQLVQAPKGKLVSQVMPAIKVTETIMPVSINEPEPGMYVVDMGRNVAGWARIHVSGPAGTIIQLRYSERLDSEGKINQRLNRRYMYQGPFQTDTYILKGDGIEVWEPRFTYHGFRYVEVTGWPGILTSDKIEGRMANTGFDRIGEFTCSNPLLNTICTMTDRSYRSNFFGYPTDCPHREKNGWTGDAHLAAEQAMLNYNNVNAYDKWAWDLWDARTPEGDLSGIAPTGGWGYHKDNGPGWGSAAVMIPWYMYLYYGDTEILADHYELMKGYVDFLNKAFPSHIVEIGRGDWCYLHTKTPGRLTSTALFYQDSRLVAHVARILGFLQDAEVYTQLAHHIKDAYNVEFYKGNGLYGPGSQTSQAVSLFYSLVPESEKEKTINMLVEAVHKAKDHIDCGILGSKALFQALTGNGHHDLAYKIATQPDFPGFGDWIAQGATTLWEDWTDTEGSFNHVAWADIVNWFYRNVAGINIDPAIPGFKHVNIRPRPVADLTSASAVTESMFGKIKSAWNTIDGTFKLDVTIPPNTTATVFLPNGDEHSIGSGEYQYKVAKTDFIYR